MPRGRTHPSHHLQRWNLQSLPGPSTFTPGPRLAPSCALESSREPRKPSGQRSGPTLAGSLLPGDA